MLTMRCAPPLLITDELRSALEAIAASPSLSHAAVRQAGGLLSAADGVSNEETARRVGVSANTVRAWRSGFAARGLAGVGVLAKGRGAKPSLPEGTVAEVVRLTLNEEPPDTSTHWTTRTLAKKMGIGKDTVARFWRDHEFKAWKVDTFKVWNDSRFEEKLGDVVGLYLDPPAKAAVFSYDAKTQCQALDRTQASLPMVRGRAGTMTHDYKRNGTTDLFAARNIATGEVITECRKQHTAADVLAFFKKIDRSVPRSVDVTSSWTTSSPTKHQSHRMVGPSPPGSLAPSLHAHQQLMVEPRGTVVQGADRQETATRGLFQRAALIDAIETWVAHRNSEPKPFVARRGRPNPRKGTPRTQNAVTSQVRDTAVGGSST